MTSMSPATDSGRSVHVVAAFEYSTTLEMALQKLVDNGISEGDIVAIPLDRRVEQVQLFDTIHRSDGKSLIDVAMIFGVIFMLLGTIYGFVLTWGPILWGLIGLAGGALFGLLVDLWHARHENKRLRARIGRSTEVFVAVKCADRREAQRVEDIFWNHFALGIGIVKPGGKGRQASFS